MTTQAVTISNLPPAVVGLNIDEPTWNALKNSIYPGAKDDSVIMAVSYCRARQLDPLMKPVHLVPMSVKDAVSGKYEMRDVVMPGVGLYRIQADRSGNYAGAQEPEFGPDLTQTFNGVEITFPQWCKYTLSKLMPNGTIVEFSAKEYWLENYATAGRDTQAPNAMWKKRPYGQLAKCFDDETEILTDEGFQLFSKVTGKILQVTTNGLESSSAIPFVQPYSGSMVTANGSRLNFSVTPNHDMLTNNGKVEAATLYQKATTDSSKWAIPRSVVSNRPDANISDQLLYLVGYLLADGYHSGYHQIRVSVSRLYKIEALFSLGLHSKVSVKKDAGREAVTGKRIIKTIRDKKSFTYDFSLVSKYMTADKRVHPEWILSLSSRQAKIVVDSLLEFDGSHNGSVRRLHQRNTNVISAFELLAIQAGYSISSPSVQKSDIGSCSLFTLSETTTSPVVKGLSKNSSSLVITQNTSGKVWCVTVPSGVIVVRRHGLSMLCGNCAEAQALRKGWPEIGQQPTAEEMEGKSLDVNEGKEHSQGSQQPSQPQALPEYSAEQFQRALADWTTLISKGKKTAAQIINTIESKYTLTSAQIKTIEHLEAEDANH